MCKYINQVCKLAMMSLTIMLSTGCTLRSTDYVAMQTKKDEQVHVIGLLTTTAPKGADHPLFGIIPYKICNSSTQPYFMNVDASNEIVIELISSPFRLDMDRLLRCKGRVAELEGTLIARRVATPSSINAIRARSIRSTTSEYNCLLLLRIVKYGDESAVR